MSPKIETRLVFSYPLYLLGGVICAFYLESFHDWVVRHRKGILIGHGSRRGRTPRRGLHRPLTARDCRESSCPARTPSPPSSSPTTSAAIFVVYLLGVYLVSPEAQRPHASHHRVGL